MAIKTLLEFATDKTLTRLLVKERVKQRGRNRTDKHHTLKKDCDLDDLVSSRKKLSRLMPPRYDWVRPSERIKKPKDTFEKRKNAVKALMYTIARDKNLQRQGQSFAYLDEQQAFFARIRSLLSSDALTFQSPQLLPILKDKDKQGCSDMPYIVIRILEIILIEVLIVISAIFLFKAEKQISKKLKEKIRRYKWAYILAPVILLLTVFILRHSTGKVKLNEATGELTISGDLSRQDILKYAHNSNVISI